MYVIPVFFSAVFGAEIRPHSPRQKVCFFPLFRKKIPIKMKYSKKKKKSAKCDDSVSEVRINSFRAFAMP